MAGAQGAVPRRALRTGSPGTHEAGHPPSAPGDRVLPSVRAECLLAATHWDQDGTFTFFFDRSVPVRSGSDDFWTVDAAISYRLPKRYGFISVGATNLFDEKFNFFDVDFDNPTIQPTRTVFARVTLAFP
jgi:hypothetical protein